MTGLIVSLVAGLAAYIGARALAARLELDPKPRGALVLTATLFTGLATDVILHRLFGVG